VFAFDETIEIARTPADVFAFLTDPAHRPEWDRSVVSETLLTPPPVKVGSSIRTRMEVMGRDLEFDWRVREFDPPHVMSAVSDSGSLPTTLRFVFSATETGCRVQARIEGRPTGMLALVEPIVSGVARSTLADGLARAKRLLEAEGAR
jgi:uncharacterized protein YndB with AHSA1/START domain